MPRFLNLFRFHRNTGDKKQKQITKLQILKGEIRKAGKITSTQIKMLKSFEMKHHQIQAFIRNNKLRVHKEANFLMNLQQT